MCQLKYVLRIEFFIFVNPDYPTTGLTVTGLEWVYCYTYGRARTHTRTLTHIQEGDFLSMRCIVQYTL